MNTLNTPAFFTFHNDLKDFLTQSNRAAPGPAPMDRRASLKDAIESFGPPHTEIGRITFNGRDADFTTILTPGARIEVFPIETPHDPRRSSLLRPALQCGGDLRFVCDANVGKLASLLRLLGLDTAYDFHMDDPELAELAVREQRILLTKDRQLLKRSNVIHGRLVRDETPERQLLETLGFYGLRGPFAPFSRCLRCNTPLHPISKDKILHRLEPLTKKYFHVFHHCADCDKIFWAGSHHERLLERLDKLGLDRD